MRIDWAYEEIVLAAELTRSHGWRALDGNSPSVIALSQLLNAANLHPREDRDEKFRNPSGVGRKTSDIATRHPDYTGTPTNGSKLDRVVLARFLAEPLRMAQEAQAIREWMESGVAPLAEYEEVDVAESEGKLLLSMHLRRERHKGLRKKKIDAVTKAGGLIRCEVCEFDFKETYGTRGAGYIEVHHVRPLYVTGEVITKLADLALLCSNCHKMVHRQPWISPAQLREILELEQRVA